ncbi:MAG TPA: hypothetical protein VGS06_27345 [Streptosporangiaceae bacterium]|nr:hypothetical protein [Streptosporangiaceae bacterium]
MSPAKTPITGIRAVSIPVENQDDALRFYAGTLGFTTLRDAPTPGGAASSNSHPVTTWPLVGAMVLACASSSRARCTAAVALRYSHRSALSSAHHCQARA